MISRHRVTGVYGLDVVLEGGAVESSRETCGEFDVMQDVAKGGVDRLA